MGGGPATQPYSIGIPSARLLSEIGKVLGREVNARKQIIILGYVRHIKNRHGAGGKAVAGQISVTMELFALIPDILENFDAVEIGHATTGGNGVLIHKRYANGNAVLVDAVPVKGNLEVRSFRIDEVKTGRGRTHSNYGSQTDVCPGYTSETRRTTPAINNKITNSPPKVNTHNKENPQIT